MAYLTSDYQKRVGAWLRRCFSKEVCEDKVERADRFLEEAIELSQTTPGYSIERVFALARYVYGRPVGEPSQEVGGVMVTLAALCETLGYDMEVAARVELDRILKPEIMEKIRAKQASKSVGSALPVTDEVREALEESVRLQNHYAELLNQYDGGERMQFKNGDAWIERLKTTPYRMSPHG